MFTSILTGNLSFSQQNNHFIRDFLLSRGGWRKCATGIKHSISDVPGKAASCLGGAFSIFLPELLGYCKAGSKCWKQAVRFCGVRGRRRRSPVTRAFLTSSLTLAHIPAPSSWWHLLPTDGPESVPSAFLKALCLAECRLISATFSQRNGCLQPPLVPPQG